MTSVSRRASEYVLLLLGIVLAQAGTSQATSRSAPFVDVAGAARAESASATGLPRSRAANALAFPFVLHDQDGRVHSLAAYSGRTVILVFCPDLGATSVQELRSMQMALPTFDAQGAKVFALTPVVADESKRVHDAERLRFPVLVDAGARVAASFGAQAADGSVERIAFVIDPDGRIAATLRAARPADIGHQIAAMPEVSPPVPLSESTDAIARTMPDVALPAILGGPAQRLYGSRKQKATVVFFTAATCPCSQDYEPRERELAKEYLNRGVRFLALYPDCGETRANVRRGAARAAYPFPALRDRGSAVAARMGARMTPEAVVVDARGVVRYWGRIDDSRDSSKVSSRDLRDAIEAVISGGTPAHPHLISFGCAISFTTANLAARSGSPRPSRMGSVRRYYIAAEPIDWCYAPLGKDRVSGQILPSPYSDNAMYKKFHYVQYTDNTFARRVPQPAWIGILGPVIRGVVGDTLEVTFLNRTDRVFSMHPHGLRYTKDDEGAYYYPNPGRGSWVIPHSRFTYIWHVTPEAGPGPGEPSSKVWLYHSHVMADADINDGLVGAIVITDGAHARPDGTPRDVDREFVTLFMIFNENGDMATDTDMDDNPGLMKRRAEFHRLSAAAQADMLEGGLKHSINGYIFGNLPGLDMNRGERVRWYVLALGSEKDLHVAHWHGETVIEDHRRRTDDVELLPGSMKVADMAPDNVGTWMFHCHVSDHMMAGMYALYTVRPRPRLASSRPKPHASSMPRPRRR